MLRHCNQCRAIVFINTVLCCDIEWEVFISDLHTSAFFWDWRRLWPARCSSKGWQSICPRRKGWLLMRFLTHPYPNLFPSLSYHLKPRPPQCTCFIINNPAEAATNSDTICCRGKVGFSSGALVGLKLLGMPFRAIHPVNQHQPAPLPWDQCQAELLQGLWKNMIYVCAQISSPCKISVNWLRFPKSFLRGNIHPLCLGWVCLAPIWKFSSIIYNLWVILVFEKVFYLYPSLLFYKIKIYFLLSYYAFYP